MSRLPLLIGASGKRTFDKKDPARDRDLADTVRHRFDTIFDKLDRDYPNTPKILLTGAAFGTDLIAADAALKRRNDGNPGWAVIALLPFERDEFRKDFDEGPNDPKGSGWAERFAQHKAQLDDLMKVADEDRDKGAPLVIVRELPKLLAAASEGQPLSRALTVEDLQGKSNASRDEHYEQVGQFIAESAMIMIAVTSANESADTEKATGGTNRIVAYRRAGHDDVGAKVANKSRILRRTIREPIAPPSRFVWLIDPYAVHPTFGSDDYPVTPLEPFSTRTSADHYLKATCGSAGVGPEEMLATSLLLVGRLERFNAEIAAEGLTADITTIEPERLTERTRGVTDIISNRQTEKNRKARLSFWGMAALFVLAVFTFEIFAKFFNQEPTALVAYLGILMLILTVWRLARGAHWHRDSEDYRAIAEMLRVQHAWWSAGLHERVDREHLLGASDDLTPVRYTGTAIIAWLLMRSAWATPHPDWGEVRGTARTARDIKLSHARRGLRISGGGLAVRADKLKGREQTDPPDWIGGQLSYFARKARDREDKVLITEAGSWTLFVASGFLGAILCLLLAESAFFHSHVGFHSLKAVSSWPDRLFVPVTGRHLSPVWWMVLAGIAVYVRIQLRRRNDEDPLAPSFKIALLTALLLSLALVGAAPKLITMFGLKLDEVHAAEAAMIVWLVGLSAIAGAWRYLTERLNIEAEALDYRDAFVRFERAEHLLAADVDESGQPRDEERARAIVFELGRLALTENEAWLKSRRERPLTPVVG